MIKELLNFKWLKGRQDSGYYKIPLIMSKWPIKFDVYILKFPENSEILPHVDEVKNGKHYRMNIILRKCKIGGEFKCLNSILDTKRIKIFRPDINEHSVSKIEKGCRYVLSIGWIINDK